MSERKLRILCIPITAAGHLNPTMGFTSVLRNRGHEVIFAIDQASAGKVSKHGFKEELFDDREEVASEDEQDANKRWLGMVDIISKGFRLDPIDVLPIVGGALKKWLENMKRADPKLEEIINKVKPDLILYEGMYWSPAVINAKVPVVLLMTSNPLFTLTNEKLPPPASGLSINGDRSEWQHFRNRRIEAFAESRSQFDEYYLSKNCPTPKTELLFHLSSNLNIYIYPKSLAADYLIRCPTAKHWIGIDHALRPSDREFEVPQKSKDLPGKLVYLSMGSLGSSDVDLMKTLVEMLSKAAPKYKLIVSKGMRHNEYELAENMWGEAYVPQLGVLPLIDLAIIHGGNNSFVETLYFGKPMIVIPLSGDQPDNAQRAVDAGIGARFNPFKQSSDELIELMDAVVDNKDYNEKLRKLSKELRESKSMEEAADALENVARNPKIPNVVIQ